MREIRGILAAAIVAMVVTAHVTAAAATVRQGQVDDFEDGTTMDWRAGPKENNPNPVPPINVTSGGPGGANDNYLLVRANGGGPGGKLVAFNSDQWSGDFIEADIDAVQMQVNNLGTTALTLRLVLSNVPGSAGLGTLSGVALQPGSGWQTVTFSLAESNLSGTLTYAEVMRNVAEFNLIHSDAHAITRSQAFNVVAELGVDNITALPVPEPAFAGLAGAGLVAAALRRGRRATSAT